MSDIDEQTKPRANITLEEVKEVMKEQFNEDCDTPEKLLAKLNESGEKAVLTATRCPECKKIFLHLSVGEELYYYKQYELWNIYWGDDHECPECDAYDTLFLQHHTGKVVFDNSGMKDVEYTLNNKETIEYCKTPLLVK